MDESLKIEINIISLLRFTLPSIIMMLIISLYTVIDGMFVSRLLGTNAFSAVNIVYPIIGLSLSVGTMFGAGTSAIVSKKLGQMKNKQANENLTFIALFTIIIGILISIFFLIFLDKIIRILGATEEIYNYCYAYAFPITFFIPFNILQLQFQNLFIANGKPNIGLNITILGGLLNIFFDYVFIAILGMGVSGAAIATGIGYCVPSIYGILYFTFKKNTNLHFVKPKIDIGVLFHAITNGLSEMISNLSNCITTFLFNIIMMGLIGQNGVAAISVILYLDFVLVAINLGYSIGISPIISYNYGSTNTSNIKKIFKISTLFSIFTGIAMTIGVYLFSKDLAAIFVTRGTFVYNLAVAGLNIYAIGYLFKGYNIFCSALFTAFSDGKTSAIISFLRTLIFLSLSLIVLSQLFGINGTWLASPIAEILSACTASFFVFKYKNIYKYI